MIIVVYFSTVTLTHAVPINRNIIPHTRMITAKLRDPPMRFKACSYSKVLFKSENVKDNHRIHIKATIILNSNKSNTRLL